MHKSLCTGRNALETRHFGAGFADADSGREGKPGTEKPKEELPSYHLTAAAKPLRKQPHLQSESVHNSGCIALSLLG